MHQCLQIADIFQNILEFVVLILPDEDNAWRGYTNRYTTNPVLAALARTCRRFSEPSIDVLWRTQYTLGPLIRTLPSHLYVEEVEDGSAIRIGCVTHHLELRPPMTSSDWVRFDYYASKIKSLGYYMFEFHDQDLSNWLHHHFMHCRLPVTPQNMELICICRRQNRLLPNLKRLRVTRFDIPLLRFIPMHLGPNLRVLNIAIYPGDILWNPTLPNDLYHTFLSKLIESLPSLCPSLTELALCTEQLPGVANTSLSFVYNCKHLVAWFVASIPKWSPSGEFLHHLSQQEHLRDIFLSLDDKTGELSWLQPVRYPFPSLDTLDMRAPTLLSCATLLQLMGSCALRLVRLQSIEGPPPAADLRELFSAFRSHCAVRTLQSLVIEHYGSEDGPFTSQTGHSFTGEIISLLYPFSRLRFFRLFTPLVCFLTDQDLRDVADHWPLLIEFRVADGWEWCVGPDFDTTWAGLAYLAWKCPQLLQVAIAIDMRVDNVAETTAQEGFHRNMHLRHVDVLDSTMCDVEQCARTVHAFAPLVWEIWGSGWGEWKKDAGVLSRLPPEQDPFGYYETATTMIREAHASEEFAPVVKYDPLEDMNPWSKPPIERPKPTWTRVS